MNNGSLLLLQLAGSVALLLWGLNMLAAAVAKQYGWRLKRFAAAAGRRRIALFGSGVVLGGGFQSSTAAILLGGQMAARGSLTTAQGLALALGADVGSTLAAQLLGFDLSALAPLLLLVAYLVNRLGKSDSARQLSHIMFGVALVIIALRLLNLTTAPLVQADATGVLLAALADEPLLLMLLAALLTFLCHSTLAVVLIVAALAGNGAIPLQTAFWLILGVNAGGGLPALLAGWGEGAAVRRITVGNALFRLLGVLMLAPFAAVVEVMLSDLAAPARAAVHFHTLLNVLMSIPLLILTPAAARGLDRVLKTLEEGNEWMRLRHLGGGQGGGRGGGRRAAPVLIARGIRETLNMGDLVARMLDASARLIRRNDTATRAEISALDDAVDYLNREIKLFITGLDESAMQEEDKQRANLVLSVITHLEHIGDIVDNGIRAVVKRMRERRVNFSADGVAEILDIYDILRKELNVALGLLVSPDARAARELHDMRLALAARCEQTFTSHLTRLRRGRPESIETSSMHLDLVRDLKRISDHIAEIADSIITVAGYGGQEAMGAKGANGVDEQQ